MHPFIQQFVKHCAVLQHGLHPGEPIAVAISGGADSVALLRLLQLSEILPQQNILALHFDHNLRPTSADDVRFVQDLCRRSGSPCHVGRWRRDPGVPSPEAENRRVRYAFLRSQARRHGARWILVAHTADDQAETVLHHVLRGAGLQGLAGIPPLRSLGESVTLFRPLLSTRRSELRTFLESIGQEFREDPSNATTNYTRNKLRHKLLPLARQTLQNDIVMSLCKTGALARQHLEFIRALAKRWIDKEVTLTRPSGCIVNRMELRSLSPVIIREIFIELWKELGWKRGAMTYEHWERLQTLSQRNEDYRGSFPGNITVSICGPRIELSASRSASDAV
jgi:tRNA(Ile)-lysidine synthase